MSAAPETGPARSVLILGYGNPLRSDDGLGWHAAEQLSQRPENRDFEILARHQLTHELAENVSRADLVFFIDASQEGEPGELRFRMVKPQAGDVAFSHELSPSALLALARDFYGKSPRAYSVSICGECFDHGEGLSPKVQDSLPDLVRIVTELGNGVDLLTGGLLTATVQ